MAKAFDVDTGGTLTTSLQAWYNLESDGTDEFSTNNMTATNTPTFSTGKIGNGGNVVRATPSYFSVASSLGWTGGAYSLSCWMKLASLPSGGAIFTLCAAEESTNNTDIELWYMDNGGTLQAWGARTKRGVADQSVIESVTLSTGTWYHFVVTYDGSTLEFWRDGVSKGTAAASGSGSAGNATRSTIGTWSQSTPTHTLDGELDLVGFWNKKLSNQEVSDLYNGGTGNAYRTQATATKPRRLLTLGVGS